MAGERLEWSLYISAFLASHPQKSGVDVNGGLCERKRTRQLALVQELHSISSVYPHEVTNPKRRPRSHLCPQCKEKEDNKDVAQLVDDLFFDVPEI